MSARKAKVKARVCKKHRIKNCTLHKTKTRKKKKNESPEPIETEIKLDHIEMVREEESYELEPEMSDSDELQPDLIVLRYRVVVVCLKKKNVGI